MYCFLITNLVIHVVIEYLIMQQQSVLVDSELTKWFYNLFINQIVNTGVLCLVFCIFNAVYTVMLCYGVNVIFLYNFFCVILSSSCIVFTWGEGTILELFFLYFFDIHMHFESNEIEKWRPFWKKGWMQFYFYKKKNIWDNIVMYNSKTSK